MVRNIYVDGIGFIVLVRGRYKFLFIFFDFFWNIYYFGFDFVEFFLIESFYFVVFLIVFDFLKNKSIW